MKAMMVLAAALAAGIASAGVVFHEDFEHYCDRAPGVPNERFLISHAPTTTGRSAIYASLEADAMVFAKPIALPAGNAFDVLFDFELAATNSAFEVVFTDGSGKELAVPVSGISGWQNGAVKSADGKLKFFATEKRRFAERSSVAAPSGLKTVNFRVKAGGKVSLTQITVRTPGPLPVHPAADQFAVRESIDRGLKEGAVSDGQAIDIAGKSYSFVPGKTGRFGTLTFEWTGGQKTEYPLEVVDQKYSSPVWFYGMPDLGIGPQKTPKDPREEWTGPESIVKFGSLASLYVRPHLKSYCNYRFLCPEGIDLVRDWETLPKASGHVTTLEVRACERGFAEVWIDGSYVKCVDRPRTLKDGQVIAVRLTLDKGVRYRANEVKPDELQLWANPRARAFAKAELKGAVEGCAKPIDSADVGLAKCFQGGFSMGADAYTSRTPLSGYPASVHYRLKSGPYTGAEILFALDDAPDKVPYLTVRLARYYEREGTGSTSIHDKDYDFTKGLPPEAEKVGTIRRGSVETPVYRMRIELPFGLCPDYMAQEYFDLEFLGPKGISLQQVVFTQKPRTDLFSAFNILGVRLRKLNVLPELVQTNPGNIFSADERERTTGVKLTAQVDGAKGTIRFGGEERAYAFAKAGESETFTFDLPGEDVGLSETPLVVTDGNETFAHTVVSCVLPEAGRLATPEESPYCTWWFSAHGSPADPALGGPILSKAGIPKLSWNREYKKEHHAKYHTASAGYVYGPRPGDFDAKTGTFRDEKGVVERMKKEIAGKPFVDHIMVWHEDAPRYGIPEELLNLPVPTNNVAQEKASAAFINAVGRLCRQHFPDLKIQIGNSLASIGAVTVPLRGGANPDYYDQIGIEMPSQTMPPERLLDCCFLGQNVTKAIAKKLSGRDIPSAGCYEFIYRIARDEGWKGEDAVAEHIMRDILISLMNRYTLIAPLQIFDNRTAYCNTIWGVCGLLFREPYVYPKKTFLAYSVITKALDGVRFTREIPTGSSTVYASEFVRKDGKFATAFWCARGAADLVCDLRGELWTMYGGREKVGGWFSDAKFTCSVAPVYVISEKPCASVRIAARSFPDDARVMKAAKDAASFKADDFTVAPDADFTSTHHDFLPILRPGAFTVRDIVDETEGPCVEVTLDGACPKEVTEFVTEFTTLRLKEPVSIAEPADLLGLRVKGNSNWGQLRFEIEDADGEVFKGKSTGRDWGCDVFDWPGYLAVSFDGWGDVYQYTDRNEADLALSPGTRMEQWVSSGGDKKIAWPIKLRAITVCMNRFKPTILGFGKTEPSIRLKKAWYVPYRKD